MIQLETYKGTKSRYTCPACNTRNCFVRYIGDGGEYISSDVGRCNRESQCGYHYKPKQYFADNPISSKLKPTATKTRTKFQKASTIKKVNVVTGFTTTTDYVAPKHLKMTLGNYERNAFVKFLFNLFPDCQEEIQAVLKMYFVGAYGDYTCFPSIDRLNRFCRAKLIRFNSLTGKRLKGEYDTSSLPSKLKLKDFQYKQIFFGEHLLPNYPNKPVAVVEAEKTAIIGSLCFSEYIWLGSNSKTWLKAERLKQLGRRHIILCPDADGFESWKDIAQDAQRQGLSVKVSNLIENHATYKQKVDGYDLADYLISEQHEINEINEFTDSYNFKVDMIVNDEIMKRDFETILEEQKSILMIDCCLSEADAESRIIITENARNIILSL